MSLTTEHTGRVAQFSTTHWTLVIAAAQTQSPEAQHALEELCRRYWYPLYVFARRKGANAEDAEDLTQSFFAGRVVTRLVLRGIDPGRGKFRTWLLNSYQNFMHNEHARQHALKRGGDAVHESLDARDAEERYLGEPQCQATPEETYDRAWGTTLLDHSLAELRRRYEEKGEAELYEELAMFLPGSGSQTSHAEAATKLGLSEAAFKMKVSRLRQELGRLLRCEIKRTVSSAFEIEEELRYLRSVLQVG